QEAAQLFAEQAKGAGVTVQIRNTDSATFYGKDYLSWPFAQDYWFTRSYLPQVANGSLATSAFNETHWNDPKFAELIQSAQRELDAAKRTDLLKQAQKIEYDSGGHIIWGFKNQVDAYSSKVTGFTPDRNMPLSSYGFRLVSLA
ncbi:peptide ABC transporter substrate-binding protein, partial [Kibdelosporangium lantanae]